MIEERRKPTWEPGLLKRATLVWALVATVLLLANWANIAARRFPDPDDIMRLVEVRDLLGGQGWFDPDQYRIDPLREVPMHWSRLVDLPLAVPVILVTLASQLAFGKGRFVMKNLEFKHTRINPASGLKRMFGPNGLIEMGKGLLKITLLGGIAGLWWHYSWENLLGLGRGNLSAQLSTAFTA